MGERQVRHVFILPAPLPEVRHSIRKSNEKARAIYESECEITVSIADTSKRNEIAFWLQTGKAVQSEHITDPIQQQNARGHETRPGHFAVFKTYGV